MEDKRTRRTGGKLKEKGEKNNKKRNRVDMGRIKSRTNNDSNNNNSKKKKSSSLLRCQVWQL
jgi:hypothetical protein